MTKFAKFLVGAAATSLLAWGAHALSGDNYIAGLQRAAEGALEDGGIAGVKVAMARDPLARVAVLSGITDPAERARVAAALMGAVPGISGVRWADDAAAAAPASGDLAPAAGDQQVAACQENIDQVMAGKVINFASSSASMPSASLAVVDEVAAALGQCTGMSVTVEGHTDATGIPEANQALSQARADAVAGALSTRGVAAERITATGFGSSRPVQPGNDEAAKAANRRIEFRLGTAAAPAGGE